MKTIRWLLIRHGEHEDEKLTIAGVGQVHDSAEQHLAGVRPDRVFYSGLARALQTALVASNAIAGGAAIVSDWIEDEGFGFAFPQRVLGDCWSYRTALQEIQEVEARTGKRVSVFDVFTKYWPIALMCGGMLYKTMLDWSFRLAQRSIKDEFVCLVGTHASMVYATLTPKETPGNVGFGEIMEYRFEVGGEHAKLVHSRLLTSTL